MYEIHILVNPEQESQMEISETIKKLLYNPKIMATVTSTGVALRQPMISGYLNATTDSSAILQAQQIAACILNVVRVKVEKLLTLSNPVDDSDNAIVEAPDAHFYECYYESHVKIGTGIPSDTEYKELALLCLKHGVQLLLNPYSKLIAPVTTMRVYDDFNVFKKRHEAFVAELSRNYAIKKQHIEKGIYDTNVFTDQGWLFNGTDYKVPIVDMDCAERILVPEIIPKPITRV